jgi:virulence-associated protein VapD
MWQQVVVGVLVIFDQEIKPLQHQSRVNAARSCYEDIKVVLLFQL